MENIENFKMVREGVITNNNFINIVVDYMRNFRIEHLYDTIKFKEERISGCPVRYFRENGKREMSYGVPFDITLFTDCWGRLFIMFNDGEEHFTTIHVDSDSSVAITKLVKLIEAESKRDDSIDMWFPYIKADIGINAKVYE